jgi:hypothetical protein
MGAFSGAGGIARSPEQQGIYDWHKQKVAEKNAQQTGEERAHEKYGLGPGGMPASMEWYLDQYNIPNMPSAKPVQSGRRQMGRGLDLLWGQATGRDPSIAGQRGQLESEAMQRQALSMARSAPGGYDPSLQRMAMYQGNQARQDIAGRVAMAEAMERQQAQRAYADATQRAQALEMQRWKDMATHGLASAGLRTDLIKTGLQDKYGGFVQPDQRTWIDKYGPLLGAGVQTLGTVLPMMFSDRELKTGIRPADKDLEEFLNALRPSTYRYKTDGPGRIPGRSAGVMAQDLERSKLGRALVTDTPEGKMVDYGRAMPLLMAAIAHVGKKRRR